MPVLSCPPGSSSRTCKSNMPLVCFAGSSLHQDRVLKFQKISVHKCFPKQLLEQFGEQKFQNIFLGLVGECKILSRTDSTAPRCLLCCLCVPTDVGMNTKLWVMQSVWHHALLVLARLDLYIPEKLVAKRYWSSYSYWKVFSTLGHWPNCTE